MSDHKSVFAQAAGQERVDLQAMGVILPATLPDDPREVEDLMHTTARTIALRVRDGRIPQSELPELIEQFEDYDANWPEGQRYGDILSQLQTDGPKPNVINELFETSTQHGYAITEAESAPRRAAAAERHAEQQAEREVARAARVEAIRSSMDEGKAEFENPDLKPVLGADGKTITVDMGESGVHGLFQNKEGQYHLMHSKEVSDHIAELGDGMDTLQMNARMEVLQYLQSLTPSLQHIAETAAPNVSNDYDLTRQSIDDIDDPRVQAAVQRNLGNEEQALEIEKQIKEGGAPTSHGPQPEEAEVAYTQQNSSTPGLG